MMISIPKKLFCFFVSMIPAVCLAAPQRIVYVDACASGVNNGTNWVDAYQYLQDALADANSAQKPVEIRVAEGNYRPDQGSGYVQKDRSATFQLCTGVVLLGGFAGTMADDPKTRDFKTYRTVLTGDLKGNDLAPIGKYGNFTSGPIGYSRLDNSLRVVRVLEAEDEVVLDGFTITGAKCVQCPGATPCRDPIGYGAGLYSYNSRLIVRNCTFEFNFAATQGGALHAEGGEYIIENCVFDRNAAGSGTDGEGGAISCYGGHVALVNSRFAANITKSLGGVVNAVNCDLLEVMNCLFAGNVCYGQGAAISSVGSTSLVKQCTFVSNGPGTTLFTGCSDEYIGKVEIIGCILSNDVSAEIFINPGARAEFSYDNIFGSKIWDPVIWGEGNIDVEPLFTNPGYWDPNGTPDEQHDDFWVDGDYHLKSQAGRWDPPTADWVKDDVTSPCIDTGDPSTPIGAEPFPNGGIINMGVYGGTAEASKSYFGEPLCETIIAGDINGDCTVNFKDFVLMSFHWLTDHNP